MSERDRQRRLHVENRLQELRSKYGREAESEPLPDWLDSWEGYQAQLAQDEPQQPLAGPAEIEAEHGPPQPEPPQKRVVERFVTPPAEGPRGPGW